MQPSSSNILWAGAYRDGIKLKVSAAPVDHQANSQMLQFIAEQFGVSKRSVDILRGLHAKHKVIQIRDPKKIPDGLLALLPPKPN